MHGDLIFTLFPLMSFLLYIVPIVFIIWFLIKFLRIQQDMNQNLKKIADKLESINKNNS